jgi:ubiquinol-cytochrome c reductase subunit 8
MAGAGLRQRGIISYQISPFRARAFPGMKDGFFNYYRRVSQQVFYIIPPMLFGMYLYNWATKENEFIKSKEGQKLHGAGGH